MFGAWLDSATLLLYGNPKRKRGKNLERFPRLPFGLRVRSTCAESGAAQLIFSVQYTESSHVVRADKVEY